MALLFLSPSLRTLASFQAAMTRLGGGSFAFQPFEPVPIDTDEPDQLPSQRPLRIIAHRVVLCPQAGQLEMFDPPDSLIA